MIKNALLKFRLFALSFFLFFALSLSATPHFEFTASARKAYQHIISLRFGEATALLAEMQLADPENLILPYLWDDMDFLTFLIKEDKGDFQKYLTRRDSRLKSIKKGPQDSPYYLYTQAEINFHWAIARFKLEGLSMSSSLSLKEAYTAYNQLVKNNSKFPDFMPNRKDLGIIHAAIGTLPDELKWAAKVFGAKGTIAQGQKEIQEVLEYARKNPSFVFQEETAVMYSFALLYLGNQSDDAWNIIQTAKLNPKQNPLTALLMSNAAMRLGKNEEAITFLTTCPRGKQYFPCPYIDYLTGLAKLRRLDGDASVGLNKFVQNYKGRTLIKEVYQKLGWYALINGDEKGYWDNMQACKTKGNTYSDLDKAALREAEKGIKPDATLLKARLLFDGGYYNNAYDLMKGKQVSDFGLDKRLTLEYTYRLGRITHKLNNTSEALRLYQSTIDNGKKEPYVFACNAALQIGLIYEAQSEIEKAATYYQLCLDISPDEYAWGLHQQAKAGLNRLGR